MIFSSGRKGSGLGGAQTEPGPGKPLTEIIVGFPFQMNGEPWRAKGGKTLTARTPGINHNRVVRQSRLAITFGDFVTHGGAHTALGVADIQIDAHRLPLLQGRQQTLDQGRVDGRRSGLRFRQQAVLPHRCGNVRLMKHGRQIQPAGFPVINGQGSLQAVHPSHHFRHRAKAKVGHDLAQVFGYKSHEVHEVFGAAGKFLAQFRVLGRNAHGAGVQVANPHHDTPQTYQRDRTETEFLGTQQAGHGHIPGRFQLTVGFQAPRDL